MDNASKNAKDMIASLQMKYNRGRQAAITSELVDIITGVYFFFLASSLGIRMLNFLLQRCKCYVSILQMDSVPPARLDVIIACHYTIHVFLDVEYYPSSGTQSTSVASSHRIISSGSCHRW
jgi:hypothetical protein